MDSYDLLADRLKKMPLTLPGYPLQLSYARLVGETSGALCQARGYVALDLMVSDLMILTEPVDATPGVTPAERSKVMGAAHKHDLDCS